MFTIEHDHDETVTTVLDNDGKHEDLQLIIGDKSVYIRFFLKKRLQMKKNMVEWLL